MKITLKGDVVKEYENGVSAADIAKSIGMGLYKSACAARVDGKTVDLRTVINEDCALDILTFDDDEGKRVFRHTASHVLAAAVLRLFPSAKYAIGPAIDGGFYYDFDVEKPFTSDDLEKIEAE
ncbi:MAG: TGS domain-containing protein, partial [Oscillospiraceae bacterium]